MSIRDEVAQMQDIINHGRHYHIPINIGKNEKPSDICKMCGLDIRHIIHLRLNDKGLDILSIVAGEEEVECPECLGNKSIYNIAERWVRNKYCSICNATGKIKRPVTVGEAINRIRKDRQ